MSPCQEGSSRLPSPPYVALLDEKVPGWWVVKASLLAGLKGWYPSQLPSHPGSHSQLSLHICHLQLLAGREREAGWSSGNVTVTPRERSILTSCKTGCLRKKSQSKMPAQVMSAQNPSVPHNPSFNPLM